MRSQISGFNVPAITSRKVNTEVELADGETFVIGGLLDNRETETFEKIPFIGDIPILGKLFQSKSKNRTNTELIVTGDAGDRGADTGRHGAARAEVSGRVPAAQLQCPDAYAGRQDGCQHAGPPAGRHSSGDADPKHEAGEAPGG